ncbi:hypothetical protein F441_11705 [Phytophthora nicotianae CJ01A1]|uniref:Uncharacterized protein n=2 Tax=Phytophthora nicotianae TaxID=4792 RepID=W2IR70_PHYNI|nr:hypothetical protein L915_11451 [Phytophthora nicotianae]ETL36704.1 hypothetical protein L916_11364 [Phytophthora nicotianae]ETP13020.1 hypothetical protein F441_11705 [Phytophthora nicotianae CJ01A1]
MAVSGASSYALSDAEDKSQSSRLEKAPDRATNEQDDANDILESTPINNGIAVALMPRATPRTTPERVQRLRMQYGVEGRPDAPQGREVRQERRARSEDGPTLQLTDVEITQHKGVVSSYGNYVKLASTEACEM